MRGMGVNPLAESNMLWFNSANWFFIYMHPPQLVFKKNNNQAFFLPVQILFLSLQMQTVSGKGTFIHLNITKTLILLPPEF